MEKNDEFNIKGERMAINRRHSSIKLRFRRNTSFFFKLLQLKWHKSNFTSYRVDQQENIPRKVRKERVF